MASVHSLFTEILRPTSLSKIILLDRVRNIIGDGELNQNYLFTGIQGIGKTTLMKILAKGYSSLYINTSEDGRIDYLREQLNDFCSTRSLVNLDKDIKIVLLDEFDGASKAFYDALRSFMEKFSANIRFIATGNYDNKIPDPILSRFTHVKFDPINKDEEEELLKKYIDRVLLLSKKLDIKWDSQETLKEFVNKDFPDFRTVINNLQTLSKLEIKNVTLNDVKKSSYVMEDLFIRLVSSLNPIENYKLLVGEYNNKIFDVYVNLTNNFPIWLEEHRPELIIKLPQILITVAKYEAQTKNSIDPILQLLACFYEIQNYLK